MTDNIFVMPRDLAADLASRAALAADLLIQRDELLKQVDDLQRQRDALLATLEDANALNAELLKHC